MAAYEELLSSFIIVRVSPKKKPPQRFSLEVRNGMDVI
jgi:hypothetical protein